MNANFVDGMILALFSLIGILVWWYRRLRRRRLTAPPAPWRPAVALVFSTILILQAGFWVRSMRDEFPLTLIAMAILGIWGFQDAIRVLFLAQRFKLYAVEIAADEIHIVPGSTGPARRRHLTIEYQFLESYQGRLTIPIQSDAMQDAFHERDLSILVRYLPDDPNVHRVAKISFGSSLEQPKRVPAERQPRDPKYNQALLLQYLSFLAGLGSGFIIFSEAESGAFVQFAAAGIGSIMLDLPVKALSEGQREKAEQFFLQLGVESPQLVGPDLISYQMEFNVGPREIRRASRIGIQIFTDIYGLDPTLALQVKQGE